MGNKNCLKKISRHTKVKKCVNFCEINFKFKIKRLNQEHQDYTKFTKTQYK